MSIWRPAALVVIMVGATVLTAITGASVAVGRSRQPIAA